MSAQDILKDKFSRDIIAKVDWTGIGSFFLVKDNGSFKLTNSNSVNESSYITNGCHKISMVGYCPDPMQEYTLDNNFRFTVDNSPCKNKDDFLDKIKRANIKPRVDYFEYNKEQIRTEILLGTEKMRELEPEKYKIAEYTKLYEEYSSLYNQLHNRLADCANSFYNTDIYNIDIYDTDKDNDLMQILKKKCANSELEWYADGFKEGFDKVFFKESEALDKTEEEKNNENIVKRLKQIQPKLKKHVEVLEKIKNEIGDCHSMDGELFFKKVAAVMLKNKDILKKMPEDLHLDLGVGEWFVDYNIETGNVTIWCKETDRRVKIEQTFNINSPLLNKQYITYKFTNKDNESKNISLPKHILPRIMNNAFILYDTNTKEQIVCKFGGENEDKKIMEVDVEDMHKEAVKSENLQSKFLAKICKDIKSFDNFLLGLEELTLNYRIHAPNLYRRTVMPSNDYNTMIVQHYYPANYYTAHLHNCNKYGYFFK